MRVQSINYTRQRNARLLIALLLGTLVLLGMMNYLTNKQDDYLMKQLHHNMDQHVRLIREKSTAETEGALIKAVEAADDAWPYPHETAVVEPDYARDSENQVVEMWSTFSAETSYERPLLNLFERVDKEDLFFSWKSDQAFWLAGRLNETDHPEWVIVRTSMEEFPGRRSFYWTVLAMLVFWIVVAATIAYQYMKARTEVPVQLLEHNAQVTLEKDGKSSFAFDVIEKSYPEFTGLAEEIDRLEEEVLTWRAGLSASESQLRRILDYIELGMMVINEDGSVEIANQQAQKTLRMEVDYEGQPFTNFIRNATLNQFIKTRLMNQDEGRIEVEIHNPDLTYLGIHMLPYPKEADEINTHSVLMMYDVTALKELAAAQEEFVTNASHELRTPVTAISGFAETLQDPSLTTEEVREFADIISKESRRLEALIRDILTLSKLDQDLTSTEVAAYDAVEATESVLTYFEEAILAKDIQLSFDSSQPTIMCQGNRHRLERILTNLVANSIQYSDPQSQIKIELKEVEGQRVEWIVADQGIGIPEEDLPRVTERFYRVDKARARNSGGTGLGLAIVSDLVRVMNGELAIDSQLGQGTTVRVTLPLED